LTALRRHRITFTHLRKRKSLFAAAFLGSLIPKAWVIGIIISDRLISMLSTSCSLVSSFRLVSYRYVTDLSINKWRPVHHGSFLQQRTLTTYSDVYIPRLSISIFLCIEPFLECCLLSPHFCFMRQKVWGAVQTKPFSFSRFLSQFSKDSQEGRLLGPILLLQR
jgi:hypothetical protein